MFYFKPSIKTIFPYFLSKYNDIHQNLEITLIDFKFPFVGINRIYVFNDFIWNVQPHSSCVKRCLINYRTKKFFWWIKFIIFCDEISLHFCLLYKGITIVRSLNNAQNDDLNLGGDFILCLEIHSFFVWNYIWSVLRYRINWMVPIFSNKYQNVL